MEFETNFTNPPPDPHAEETATDPSDNGADLLDQVCAKLRTHVVFANDHQPVANTLWIAATHGLEAWHHATRLCITSPVKRCAKSRLMDITAGMSHQPLAAGDISPAAVYRSIPDNDSQTPTVFLDEGDVAFGTKKAAEQNEDLRGLLNNGYQRDRPTIRCVGPRQIPTAFPTFSMAAIAAIKGIPDTITDRAVNIALRRRAPGERVAPFRLRRDGPELRRLHDQLHAWARDPDRLRRLKDAEPQMPVEDRAADTWEPLIAIADEAGGHWPKTARTACRILVAAADSADEANSTTLQLLSDIRQIFAEQKVPFMPSVLLVGALKSIEESPWSEFDLTQNRLAYRLKEFGVKSKPDKTGKARGYRLEDLKPVFDQYLAVHPSETVKPSNSPPDQGEPFDTSESFDTSNCQTPPPDGHEVSKCQEPSNDNRRLDGKFDGLTVLDTPRPRMAGGEPFPSPLLLLWQRGTRSLGAVGRRDVRRVSRSHHATANR